jgi:hypothetical protein
MSPPLHGFGNFELQVLHVSVGDGVERLLLWLQLRLSAELGL